MSTPTVETKSQRKLCAGPQNWKKSSKFYSCCLLLSQPEFNLFYCLWVAYSIVIFPHRLIPRRGKKSLKGGSFQERQKREKQKEKERFYGSVRYYHMFVPFDRVLIINGDVLARRSILAEKARSRSKRRVKHELEIEWSRPTVIFHVSCILNRVMVSFRNVVCRSSAFVACRVTFLNSSIKNGKINISKKLQNGNIYNITCSRRERLRRIPT